MVIREIEVPGVQFRNVPAVTGDAKAVGLGLLRHMDFVVDFPNAVAWRTRISADPQSEFAIDASGLRFVWDDHGFFRVRRIEDDSAAAGSGIKVGDEITRIGEMPTSELSHWRMREILSQAGTTVPIQLSGDGKPFEVDLLLKRNSEYPPKWKQRSTEADDFFNSLQKESSGEKK